MKKSLKIFTSFILACSLVFGFVSCNSNVSENQETNQDESSDGVDTSDGNVTKGTVEAPIVENGVTVVTCTDENGGKYVFKQTNSVQRSTVHCGTWEYIIDNMVKFSGTYTGDITAETEIGTISLTIIKVADENGTLKSVKAEVSFNFTVTADKTFTAEIPEVEISDEVVNEYADFISENMKVVFDEVLDSVQTVPSSEEEFNTFVQDVVIECMGAFATVSASRSVEVVGEKMKDTVAILNKAKEIYWKVFDEVKEIIQLNNESETWKNFIIDFDESLNVGNISFSEWFDIVIDFAVQIDNEMVENGDTIELMFETTEDCKLSIAQSLGLSVDILNDYIAILDEYVSVEQLYVALDADLNFEYIAFNDVENHYTNVPETEKDALLGSVYADVLISMGITDISGFIADLYKMALKEELVNFDLPVKALAVNAGVELDAKMTYEDLLNTPMDGTSVSISEFLYGVECSVEMAVCTKDNVGGILSISYDFAYDKDDISKIYPIITGNKSSEEASQLLNSILEPRIKIDIYGNGSKFSNEYTISDIQVLIEEFVQV